MRFEPTDRRRIVLVAIVTIVLAPFVARSSGSTRPAAAPGLGGANLGVELIDTTVATGAPAPAATSVPVAPITVPPASTEPSIPFLAGPSSVAPEAPILVGVPAAAPGHTLQGLALYRTFPANWKNLPRPCEVDKLAPAGTAIAVTNLNNARTITCIVVTHATLPAGHIIALADTVFAEIADVIDSPIPVRISWS